MIREATEKIINKQNLTYDEASSVTDEIMSGKTSPVQTAAFLALLSTKGETIEEITACASTMRSHALKVNHNIRLMEIVGTGGDRSNSFNISTTSAFVISAAGVAIAKHGNRAASSKCGAADVLETLGINIDLSPEKCVMLLEKIGICFFFAQKYHTSMKYVGPVRKELGIRTVFNILGPLTNPAKPSVQLMGVYSEKLLEPLAHVLQNLGAERGMVVYGTDCLDEISASAPTKVCEFNGSEFSSYEITPEQFGFARCNKSDLIGGSPEVNAQITLDILSGAEGAKTNAVLLNSGAALYLYGKAASITDGIKLASDTIKSGAALLRLNEFRELSNK